MKKRQELLRALKALCLEVDSSICDSITIMVHEALDEEYHRGIEEGKVIEKYGTTNWIE